MKTIFDGYRKLGVTFAAIVGLPHAGIPDNWVWPVTALVGVYVLVQGAIDFAGKSKGASDAE